MSRLIDIRVWLPTLSMLMPLAACKKEQKAAEETPKAAAEAEAEPEPKKLAEGPEAKKPEQPEAQSVTLDDAGFKTPESVTYDADADVYYVSNIDGTPLEKDGKAFISKIEAGSQKVELKWIDGEAEGITLNAPKGIAVKDDVLYVADIDVVRKFDRNTGEAKGEIPLKGSTFVNGLAVGPDAVYASDTGMKKGDDGFTPSGTDAIYKIGKDDKVEKIAEGKDLNGPNGLTFADGSVWAVTFRANELYRIQDGKKQDVQKLDKGSLDGLVQTGDGKVLISSWEGQTIYQGPPSGPFEAVVSDVKAPADIGWDSNRNRILIPLFEDSKVRLEPLTAPGA